MAMLFFFSLWEFKLVRLLKNNGNATLFVLKSNKIDKNGMPELAKPDSGRLTNNLN